MANAAGLFGLTMEKQFINTVGVSVESETLVKGQLLTNTATPNFDTNVFVSALNTDEPAASGTYAIGGSILTSTDITIGSPAATNLKFVTASPSWTGATLTARSLLGYLEAGTAAQDMVLWNSYFGGSDVSSTTGTYSVTCPTDGWYWFDYA